MGVATATEWVDAVISRMGRTVPPHRRRAAIVARAAGQSALAREILGPPAERIRVVVCGNIRSVDDPEHYWYRGQRIADDATARALAGIEGFKVVP